jgi:C-terminal processing protease CtpA/Prc
VAERFDVRIPNNGKNAQLGVISLLEGNEMDSHLNGWIGLYVARKEEKLKVSAVNAWVPANSAGIEVGDALLSVNGRDTKTMGPRTAAFLLRGPSGSSVTLEVESSDGKRRQVTLKRILH